MELTENKTEAIDVYESSSYKRSRKAYYCQRLFELFIFTVICDPYLSKLLLHIGVSDHLIGIIATFVSLTSGFELLSIAIASKMKNVKKTVITGHGISQLLYMTMFFIPFLPISEGAKTIVVTILLILGYAFFYMISSILYNWKTSFINPDHRSTFTGGVESVATFVGMVFSVVMSMIIDFFEAKGSINTAFLFLGISVFVFMVGNIISLLHMKNIKMSDMQNKKRDTVTIKEVIDNTFKNKSYVYIVISSTLYLVSTSLVSGFMGTYRINELMMSLTLIQVISIGSSIMRIIAARPLGMYADKFSCAKGFKLAYTVSLIGAILSIFTTRSTWWLTIISYLTGGLASIGTNSNNFNVIYNYVDKKYFVQALAIKNCISGLLGFGASIVGGWILKAIQENGNVVFGIHMYGQQFLSIISAVLLVITILFLHFFVEKQKILKQ